MIGLDGVTRWICGGGMPRRMGERLIVEGIVRDATVEMQNAERLREAARTDSLTGIFNRRHFSEVLEEQLESSRKEHRTPGLLLVDVDHFKAVTDTSGQPPPAPEPITDPLSSADVERLNEAELRSILDAAPADEELW